ncbi:hypothetical protein [Nitrospira sp. Kam-Ns4a]
MAASPDDAFLDEVLELFALEAREWLDQLEAALHELEGCSEPGRLAGVFATIQRALMNLGGSAATVEQPTIEQAAFALLPLVEALQVELEPASSPAFDTLKRGVSALQSAMARLVESGTVPRTGAASGAPTVVADRDRSAPHEEAAAAEPEPVVMRRLDEWEQRNRHLLTEVQARLPALRQALAAFQGAIGEGAGAAACAETVLQEIELIESAAGEVGATAIQTFLHGLRSFVRIAAAGRITVPPQRVAAVQTRLDALLSMAEAHVHTTAE